MNFNRREYVNTVREMLSRTSVVWLGLVFAGYFLVTTRQGSAIPAYFLALTGLFASLVSPRQILSRLRGSWSFQIFVLLLLYVLLSLMWYYANPLPQNALHSVTIDVVVLLFVAITFAQVRASVDLSLIVFVCTIAGATISGAILLMVEVGGLNLDRTGAWNVHSVAAIAFGFVLLVAINYSIKYRHQFTGILYSVAALVCLAVVFLLQSPVVFFGLLVAMTALSFAALWESSSEKQSLYWLLLCAVLMILVLQVFNVLVEEKRSDIWASTISESFTQSVIFGKGYSAISTPVLKCESLTADCRFDHPHNLFVSLIYQLGLVGFMLLFVLYLAALGGLFERHSEQRWLLGGCLVYAGAIFMFDGQMLVANMDFVWLIFWLPLFLVMREEFLVSDH